MSAESEVIGNCGLALRQCAAHIPRAKPTSVPTGFDDLDKASPLFTGDLVVLAGAGDRGMSQLAMAIAANMALGRTSDKLVRRVGIFSLNMTLDEYALAMICAHAKVSPHTFSRGFLSSKNQALIDATVKAIDHPPIFIDDKSFLYVTELLAKAKAMKAELSIDLFIIDKFPLIEGGTATATDEHGLPYYQHQVAKLLQGLARDLNVPIIALTGAHCIEEREVESEKDPWLRWFALLNTVQYPDTARFADDVWLLEWPCRKIDDPEGKNMECASLRLARDFGQHPISLHYDHSFGTFSNWPASDSGLIEPPQVTRSTRTVEHGDQDEAAKHERGA